MLSITMSIFFKIYIEQPSGGYSISVNEFYETEESLFIDTTLIGPGKAENVTNTPTRPYIVIKTENRCSCPRRNIFFVRKSRLAKMHMDIHKPRRYDTSCCIDNMALLRSFLQEFFGGNGWESAYKYGPVVSKRSCGIYR